jgi:hypothetical protein
MASFVVTIRSLKQFGAEHSAASTERTVLRIRELAGKAVRLRDVSEETSLTAVS